MDGFLMVLLGVALFAIPLTGIGTIVQATKQSSSWKPWFAACLWSLATVLVVARMHGKFEDKPDPATAVADAAKSEPYYARSACEDALKNAAGKDLADLLQVPPVYEQDEFNTPEKQADGSYPITSVKVGPGDVAGGLMSRWMGKCTVQDGKATIVERYQLDGYEPGTRNGS